MRELISLEYVTSVMPEGAPTPQSAPATHTSMSQSSTRNSQAPRPAVASTTRCAPRAWTAFASCWTSTRVPVNGSIRGARTYGAASAGVAPRRRTRSAEVCTKRGLPTMATLSPSSSVFRTASSPPLASAESAKQCELSVINVRRPSWTTSSMTAVNWGSNWPISGVPSARSTLASGEPGPPPACRRVGSHGSVIGISPRLHADEGDEALQPVVVGVHHHQAAEPVDEQRLRTAELAGLATPHAVLGPRHAERRQHLHAMVVGVGHVDVAAAVDREPARIVELARSAAVATPLGGGHAAAQQFLDAVIAAVGNEDGAVAVEHEPKRLAELTRGLAGVTPDCHDVAKGRQLLDAIVARIRDVDVALVIDGDAARLIELAGRSARRAPCVEEDARRRQLLDAIVGRVGDRSEEYTS